MLRYEKYRQLARELRERAALPEHAHARSQMLLYAEQLERLSNPAIATPGTEPATAGARDALPPAAAARGMFGWLSARRKPVVV
jgi:hypothetical protein